MAVIAKVGDPTLAATLIPHTEQIPHLTAGEGLEMGDLVEVNANGLVMKHTTGTPRGLAAGPAQVGEAITIYRNVRIGYGSGLTPGADVYAGTGGAIDDTTVDGTPIGWCVDDKRIQFNGF